MSKKVDEVFGLMPVFKFEKPATIQQFIHLAGEETPYDLSDLLIACSAKAAGCESVIAFDKKASQFEMFKILDDL